MLIYCISYIGFRKNPLVHIKKAFLGPPQHTKLSPKFSLIRIFLYLDKIDYPIWTESLIRENTDKILSIYGKIQIRESPYLVIFQAVEFSVILTPESH